MNVAGNIYSFFKDFAGPIATVLASVTAAYFVYQQWKTAEKQADTAIDQLRYNLFTKRIFIYEDVKKLLRMLINDSHRPDFDSFSVAQHYVVIDEAIFFFSPQTCAWLHSVRGDCQKFLEGHASSRAGEGGDPRDAAARQLRLVEHFKAMPTQFQKELGFRQLMRNGEL